MAYKFSYSKLLNKSYSILSAESIFSVLSDSHYWTTSSTSFQSFAEYSEPVKCQENVWNTSLTVQSFFLISAQVNQKFLRKFSEVTLTFNARVVCSRSVISEPEICRDTQFSYFCGRVTPEIAVPELIWNSIGVHFKCPASPVLHVQEDASLDKFSADVQELATVSTWTLCRLNASAEELIPVLDSTNNSSLKHQWSEDSSSNWVTSSNITSWSIDISNAYLILNFSSSVIIRSVPALHWILHKASGSWLGLHYQDKSNQTHITMHISICYDVL